jgi:hypothetical protein
LIQADVSQLGYSYTVQTTIDAVDYATIVDTGSYVIVYYNNSIQRNTELNATILVNGTEVPTIEKCWVIQSDQTIIQWQAQYPERCVNNYTSNSVGTASAGANTTRATLLAIENDKLHDWSSSTGDIGLSYKANCFEGSANCTTSFQDMLLSASGDDSMVFGLDFLDSDTGSSMQLGGVKPEYKDNMEWTSQCTSTPQYHQFFLQDLYFCGINILGNYSNTWPVIIDTSCTCLELPAEIYDYFGSWLNSSHTVEELLTMPSFSFGISASDGTGTFHVPLSSLLVNASVFATESGAPNITIAGEDTDQRLCVLRGPSIITKTSFDSPNIVLGTLALQSIYFAADFSVGSVGLASKLTSSEVGRFQNAPSDATLTGVCSAVTPCIGNQAYTIHSNSCKEPNCNSYFFVTMDPDTHECIFERGPLIGGLVFVIIIALMEVIAYLVVQHSVTELHLSRRAAPNVERGAYQRLSLGEPDIGEW